MSRIGKKQIAVPKGVLITEEDRMIIVKGPLGTLSFRLPASIYMVKEDAVLRIQLKEQKKRLTHQLRARWGTARAILANMIAGVTKEFEKRLEVEGVGYRVALEGTTLVFALGFSHPVRFAVPVGITCKVEKNSILVSGISKESVGQTASAIRSLKPPEPYKGKGIRYAGEIIRKKAGKKAVGAT